MCKRLRVSMSLAFLLIFRACYCPYVGATSILSLLLLFVGLDCSGEVFTTLVTPRTSLLCCRGSLVFLSKILTINEAHCSCYDDD